MQERCVPRGFSAYIRDVIHAWQAFLSTSSSPHVVYKLSGGSVGLPVPVPWAGRAAWAAWLLRCWPLWGPGKVPSLLTPALVQVILLAGGWEVGASFIDEWSLLSATVIHPYWSKRLSVWKELPFKSALLFSSLRCEVHQKVRDDKLWFAWVFLFIHLSNDKLGPCTGLHRLSPANDLCEPLCKCMPPFEL